MESYVHIFEPQTQAPQTSMQQRCSRLRWQASRYFRGQSTWGLVRRRHLPSVQSLGLLEGSKGSPYRRVDRSREGFECFEGLLNCGRLERKAGPRNLAQECANSLSE